MVPVLLTFGGALTVCAFSFLPSVRESAVEAWSILGAATVLLAWAGVLLFRAAQSGRRFEVVVALKRQHWLQACAHLSIFWYWGREWPPVSDYAWLIAAQVVGKGAFKETSPATAVQAIVTRVMGLGSSHSRYAAALSAMNNHYTAQLPAKTPLAALQETFTLACMTPDAMAVGF